MRCVPVLLAVLLGALLGAVGHIDPALVRGPAIMTSMIGLAWASALAIKLLPTPQGPVISTLRLSLIQVSAVSMAMSFGSSPRGARVSRSSSAACCGSFAQRKR